MEPIVIAQKIGIKAFVVFDADGNVHNDNRAKHEKDNRNLLRLLGGDESTPFPASVVWGSGFVQWPFNLGKTLSSDIGDSEWQKTFGRASKQRADASQFRSLMRRHTGTSIGWYFAISKGIHL